MTEVARQLRREATRSEDVLWQVLRDRQLDGRKFRRQQPVGAFVLDFYCAEERLAVEVDGSIHETQREADQVRQEMLETLGIRFVRVTAAQVEQDLSGVLHAIRGAFLAPAPLPPVGEGPGVRGNNHVQAPVVPDRAARRGDAVCAGGGVGAQEGANDEENIYIWVAPLIMMDSAR